MWQNAKAANTQWLEVSQQTPPCSISKTDDEEMQGKWGRETDSSTQLLHPSSPCTQSKPEWFPLSFDTWSL